MHTTIESNRERNCFDCISMGDCVIGALVHTIQSHIFFPLNWLFFFSHISSSFYNVLKKKSESVPCDMKFRHSIYEYYTLFFTSIKLIQIECHLMTYESKFSCFCRQKIPLNSFEILNDYFLNFFFQNEYKTAHFSLFLLSLIWIFIHLVGKIIFVMDILFSTHTKNSFDLNFETRLNTKQTHTKVTTRKKIRHFPS